MRQRGYRCGVAAGQGRRTGGGGSWTSSCRSGFRRLDALGVAERATVMRSVRLEGRARQVGAEQPEEPERAGPGELVQSSEGSKRG